MHDSRESLQQPYGPGGFVSTSGARMDGMGQGGLRTPYDYFRKPKQPDNLLGSLSFGGPQESGSGLLTYFQDEEGEFDLDKLFATTGQMTNLFQRAMPLVMRLASLAKGRT